MTGQRRSLDRGKDVATAMGGSSAAGLSFPNPNMLFERRGKDVLARVQALINVAHADFRRPGAKPNATMMFMVWF